jgi:hypothetical protein
MEKKRPQAISSRAITFCFLVVAVLGSSIFAEAENVVVIPLVKNHISAISPSDVLELGTTSIAPGATADVVSITPRAGNAGDYTVPTGKYFVITSVTVFPQSPGAGKIQMQLIQNSSVRSYWVLSNSQPTELSFGPGMLIAAGYSLNISNFASSPGNIRVAIYGYLTDE